MSDLLKDKPYFYAVNVSLKSIPNGTKVVVREITASSLRVKLLEMGIVEGKELEVLYRAPFGDPMAIQAGEFVLSLRNDEAEYILVNS